nr:kynurenine formamidase [Quercus suber]
MASLNYRLSPNPSHPTHPSHPADPARNARHPDHIADVLAAVLHLQQTYHFGARYLLVGHSCGATLALQLAMKRYWGAQYEATDALELNVVPPVAVLGVEGLYDLPALVAFHARESAYRGFVTGAFGGDEEVWKAVSPAHGEFGVEEWEEGRLVVLAQSHEDELVEWEQTALQERRLKEQGWEKGGTERRVEVLELKGKHDQVWEQGTELARAITYTINELVGML